MLPPPLPPQLLKQLNRPHEAVLQFSWALEFNRGGSANQVRDRGVGGREGRGCNGAAVFDTGHHVPLLPTALGFASSLACDWELCMHSVMSSDT